MKVLFGHWGHCLSPALNTDLRGIPHLWIWRGLDIMPRQLEEVLRSPCPVCPTICPKIKSLRGVPCAVVSKEGRNHGQGKTISWQRKTPVNRHAILRHMGASSVHGAPKSRRRVRFDEADTHQPLGGQRCTCTMDRVKEHRPLLLQVPQYT